MTHLPLHDEATMTHLLHTGCAETASALADLGTQLNITATSPRAIWLQARVLLAPPHQVCVIEQTRRYGDGWTITGTHGGTWSRPSVVRLTYDYAQRPATSARDGVERMHTIACTLPGQEYVKVGMYWE